MNSSFPCGRWVVAGAIALLTTLANLPSADAKIGVTVQEPVKEPLKAVTTAGPGGTYPAPGGQATLIYSTTSTAGDFPEATVFVKQGKHIYDLGAYRVIAKVKWAPDGRSVSFEGNKLVAFGLDDVSLVTYKLGEHVLSRKVLRRTNDTPSG
jgi:hypothetical protein